MPNILVTGANGLLGRTLASLDTSATSVVGLGRAELDIADPGSVARALEGHRPDVVVNPAAMTDVDGCERDPEAAERANVRGPATLADACARTGARLVHVSTDFVFDGEKREPYTIEDEPRPLSVYGRSKLDGERAVLDRMPDATIVRVSWLFGPGGRNFLSRLFEYAATGSTLKGITNMRSAPTYAPDGAKRILEIIRRAVPGTYHVCNGGEASWHEVARTALDLGGLGDVELAPVTAEALGLPARRPRYSVMRCVMSERLGFAPMRPWRDAVAEFVRASVGDGTAPRR
jgi:dTDP-4-dehydrorhamnose reductase